MKAIVTGHTRGLGQAVASALLGRGIPVLGLARSECPELAAQFPELLQQATVDLADPDALQIWLNGIPFRDRSTSARLLPRESH